MIRLWLKTVFVGHSGRLVGAAVGLALPVALLASLGTFVIASSESMARRAVAKLRLIAEREKGLCAASGRPSAGNGEHLIGR